MGEVTNLASGGGGWFAEQLSTYFRAYYNPLLKHSKGRLILWNYLLTDSR